MLVVAIDTSGRNGSIALCRGDGQGFQVLHKAALAGGTYSARLLPAITEALQQSGISKEEVDGFAIVSGPGSFTGLRVGLATIKGLSETLQKPVAAVSMLEALAVLRGGPDAKRTTALDAGRGEVYIGEYKSDGGKALKRDERIAKLQEFAVQTAATSAPTVTPDPVVARGVQEAGGTVTVVLPVGAEEIARIGIQKLLANQASDIATLDVNYIRRSDAEIFSAPGR